MPMSSEADLTLTMLQTELHWEKPGANLRMLTEKINALGASTDLIVLPEMFTTGFTMEAESLAEPMEGRTLDYMRSWSETTRAVVCGSYIVKEDGHYYNRLLWVEPSGRYQYYDKRHLFTLAGEHHTYTAGRTRLMTHLKGWKICPLVCYDLRFPVWSRNTEEYDLLVYIANFPARRAHAWNSLLVARAIENQSFTIGLNRVGTDGNDIYYSGDSSVIDYAGRVMYRCAHCEDIFTVTLSYQQQQAFRQRYAFLADRDAFSIDEEKKS